MNKSSLHKVLSFVLAVMVLSASTGFTVDMHYCGTEMQSFSIFGEAEACLGMEAEVGCNDYNHDSEARERHCTLAKKKCCEDKMLYVQPIEDLNVSSNYLTTEITDQEVILVTIFVWESNLQASQTPVDANDYIPPLLFRTSPVLLQSFLI